MKTLIALIISGALVVSGYSQTRNVLVNTNNVVVQPTNFWSADASNARTGLGLGNTNTVDFNRVTVSNGTVSSPAIQVGTNSKGLFGIGSIVYLAAGGNDTLGVSAGGIVVDGDIVVYAAGQTRTNFGLVWSGLTNADASSFRTALGLGTSATNPSSAFQSSSANLTNLASSNGGILTNLQATNLVGTIPASNIATVNFSNVAGTLAISSGGTGATNQFDARQNLGATTVGDALFTASNAPAARSAISALATNGDATNLTNFPALLLRTNGNGAGLTNITASNISGTVALASNVTGTIAISNGGSGATTAGGARTNLGLGATWLTNTTASNFRTAIGLGVTNEVEFGRVFVNGIFEAASNRVEVFQPILIADRDSTNDVFQFETATDRGIARTNLGLGWPALTNTNAGTGLVSVNTNGEVVSPTNFWQVAPISTLVQLSQPNGATNSVTNAATNARNLYLYSLTTNVVNTTNTILLPTNGGTFLGDVATIIHEGPTSSVTAVRQTGAGSNIITLNQFQEAVKFIYESGGWRLADNISYVESIYFSGTNAVANAAASRTNLGLGATWLTNTSANSFRSAIELGQSNSVTFGGATITDLANTNGVDHVVWVDDTGTFVSQNVANTRTNLGLPLAALTNTNNATFQEAIFTTNAAPTNAGNFGDHVAWMGVSIVTNGVTNVFKIPLYK